MSLCPVRPAVSLMLLFALNSLAWVYPEHRDITLLALQARTRAARFAREAMVADLAGAARRHGCVRVAAPAVLYEVTRMRSGALRRFLAPGPDVGGEPELPGQLAHLRVIIAFVQTEVLWVLG